MSEPSDTLELGKYRIKELIGSGGMAEVYQAVLKGAGGFEKPVAIKLIHEHHSENPEFHQMFQNEASLAAKLDHPNIVKVTDYDQEGQRYYIAMELVEGRNLSAVQTFAKKAGRLISVKESLVIGFEVAKGLSYAHGELNPNVPRIVHRDIKPQNILLSKSGEVKITDFGIAKLQEGPSLTRLGLMKGTAAYCSPEQVRGEPLDGRSDLFSLGVVLWELLTGRRLIVGDSDLELNEKTKALKGTPPSRVNPAVPSEVDRLVEKLLENDRERRYGSAREVANDLDRAISDLLWQDRTALLVSLYEETAGLAPRRTKILKEDPGGDGPKKSDVRRRTTTRVLTVGAIITTGLVAVSLAFFLIPGGPAEVNAPEPAKVTSPAPVAVPPPSRVTPSESLPGVEKPNVESVPTATKAPEKTESPKPKRQVTPQTKRGFLSIRIYHPPGGSTDEVTVFWEGKKLGTTPLPRVPLPVGVHSLLLVNDSIGFKKAVEVAIEPNEVREVAYKM